MTDWRRLLPMLVVLAVFGLGNLVRTIGTPSFETTRPVDAVQLVGTGMCLGAAVLALVLFQRSPRSSSRSPTSGRLRVSHLTGRKREDARSLEGLALLGTTSAALTGQGEQIGVEGFRVTCNTFGVPGASRSRIWRVLAVGFSSWEWSRPT